jgi:hypothetical protein
MTNAPIPDTRVTRDHQTWILSRLQVERDFFTVVREGFTMIAAGFGSFAFFEGVTAGHASAELPKVFALAITAAGIIVIVLATQHNRKMKAWINADEYGSGPVPELPDEQRTERLAMAVVLIGVISFIALLRLP